MKFQNELLWPTPLMRGFIDNQQLIDELKLIVLNDLDAYTSDAAVLTKETVKKLLHNNEPSFRMLLSELKVMIDAFFKINYNVSCNYGIEPFYLVHMQGNFISYHNHSGSILTGAVYLNVPSGEIELHDPRANANRSMPSNVQQSFSSVRILPKVGEVLLFPSSVYHNTTPNITTTPRVLISFDVTDKGYD